MVLCLFRIRLFQFPKHVENGTRASSVACRRERLERLGCRGIWREMHLELMRRSRNVQQVPVDTSGHFLQGEQPETVAGAILQVLETISAQRSVRSATLRYSPEFQSQDLLG